MVQYTDMLLYTAADCTLIDVTDYMITIWEVGRDSVCTHGAYVCVSIYTHTHTHIYIYETV